MEQRFTVSVDGRDVCYRRAGSGPPVVLLHEMPRSSIAVLPLLRALARRFTVFAFDMPGHGCSDPLPIARPDIEDYADALAQTLAALGMPPVPLYGTHTGAALALDMANRHPERIAIAVLDGLSLFTDAERDSFLRHYLTPFTPNWEGAHLAWLWSRVRDQYSFFPWHLPGNGSRLLHGPPPLEQHQQVAMDILRAGDRYRVAYSAAVRYRAFERLQSARVPVILMAREDDLLFPHLDRLPSGIAESAIRRLGTDRDIWAAEVAACLAVAPDQAAPAPAPQSRGVQFAHDPDGALLIRTDGPTAGRPLVFLHNQPGSSLTVRPLTRLIAQTRTAIAIDAPGSGESTAGGDAAERILNALDRLGVDSFDAAGAFTGAALATLIARRAGERVRRLTLIDPPPGGAEGERLRDGYPLDIPLHWDGRHMMMAWHRQRDALLYRPWFDRSRSTMTPMPHAIDLDALQERTIATLQGAAHDPRTCRDLLSVPIGEIARRLPRAPDILQPADPRQLATSLNGS